MSPQLEPSASFLVRPRPALADRVRAEYLEIPGLLLTEVQARRLFHLDADVCARLLTALCAEGFLVRNATGRFGRRAGH
jgi:hypothetical protein